MVSRGAINFSGVKGPVRWNQNPSCQGGRDREKKPFHTTMHGLIWVHKMQQRWQSLPSFGYQYHNRPNRTPGQKTCLKAGRGASQESRPLQAHQLCQWFNTWLLMASTGQLPRILDSSAKPATNLISVSCTEDTSVIYDEGPMGLGAC